MDGMYGCTPAGHIEVIHDEKASSTVPMQLVTALEDITLATTRVDLFEGVGRALFGCTKARTATIALWNPDQNDYYVEANFHDGAPWGFHVGDPVAPYALVRGMAIDRKPRIRALDEGEALDSNWFTYPCFLGVPIGPDDPERLLGGLVLGFMRREAVTPDVLSCVRLVATTFESTFKRVGRYTNAVRAGQALERDYILQQLHDSAVQDIFACEMAVSAALEDAGLADDTRLHLESALERARQANRSLRLILSGSLTSETFPQKLRTLVDLEIAAHVAQGGSRVTSIVDNDLTIGEPLYGTCKAVLHEALCNARKHANAANIVIMGSVSNGTLVLNIEDDGEGVCMDDLSSAPGPDGLPHFGLENLRRSVEACGGTFQVESEPDAGFVVRTRLPLEMEL